MMGAVLAQEPAWLVIFLAALVLSAGATYWYLRRLGFALVAPPAAQPEVTEQLRRIEQSLDVLTDKLTER